MHENVVDSTNEIPFAWLLIAFLQELRFEFLEEWNFSNNARRLGSKHYFTDPPKNFACVKEPCRARRHYFS